MRRARRTTVLSVGFASLIAGIGFARLSYSTLAVGWILLCVPLVLAALLTKLRWLPLACIVFAGFTFGWWRGGQVLYQAADYEAAFGEKVTVQVKADSDGAYDDKGQMIFDASKITIIEPEARDLIGRITVAGFGSNDIRRGDMVIAEGKLYPTRGGKQARMSFAQMKVESRSNSVIEKLRRRFLANLRTNLPEPQASFGAGLLIGQTRELPQEYVDILRIVGLSHIIAVSGYNLTILAELFNKKVNKRSKFRGLVFSLLFIIIFVALAGTSASIARAAVVAILSVIAGFYGRKFKPVLLILFVAAASAYLNPLNVWGDIGWYLSFLAFFGVLVLAPAIQKRLWKKSEPKLFAKIALESFSAQIMTLPFVLFIFGQLSVVSLASNLIVLPLIPLAMLLTATAGIAGMLP
nr:ComEC family competence protein [bacterium]